MKKIVYTVECFVPKMPNVMNDKDKWAVCHKISNYAKALSAYENRIRSQPDVK